MREKEILSSGAYYAPFGHEHNTSVLRHGASACVGCTGGCQTPYDFPQDFEIGSLHLAPRVLVRIDATTRSFRYMTHFTAQ